MTARERPILFSAPMVRAILTGTKVQTRRLIKPQPNVAGVDLQTPPDQIDNLIKAAWNAGFVDVRCPYGEVGDRLWVKETIRLQKRYPGPFGERAESTFADGTLTKADAWPWKRPVLTAVYCPRGLSRITLEVTDVRVERLQEISENDARAEGVLPLQMDAGSFLPAFEGLWDSINAKLAPWSSNPFVWVVSFRRMP